MACTRVNTLRPGRAPPTRPDRSTMSLIRRSRCSRTTRVATSNSPALATRFGSSKVTSMRSIPRDTDVTESMGEMTTYNTVIFPAWGHFPRIRGLQIGQQFGGSRPNSGVLEDFLQALDLPGAGVDL